MKENDIHKKLSIQAALLALVVFITWLIDWWWGIILDVPVLSLFLFLSLFIFFPSIALCFMRKKMTVFLGRAFRFTAYSISFVFAAIFISQLFSGINDLYYEFYSYESLTFFVEHPFRALGGAAIYLALAIVMYIIARINKSLDEKFSLITKDNRETLLVVWSIFLVLAIGLYIWHRARTTAFFIEGMNSRPGEVETAIRDAYSLAFKKIILIGGSIFTSTFLLLKVVSKRNKQ